MLSKLRYVLSICFAIAFTYSLSLANSAARQKPSSADLPSPEIFGPGIISGPANDGSPTFSPDGNMLFFTRSSARWSIILESRRIHGRGSQPKVASFSGEWSDASPAMAPDGSYLIFVSVRPLPPNSSQIGHSDNKEANLLASHIWRVSRVGSGWSAPVELPEVVNFCRRIFRPSVSAGGTIYFTAIDNGKNLSLFRSRYENGTYQKAEALSFSTGNVKDVDPEIAPDESFLVFSSNGRRTDETSHEHLFIVYKEGKDWSAPAPIRYSGDNANGSSDDNDARLASDHRTLYFTSDRSIPVHLPRTRAQALQDYERLQTWDNSNSNVWIISLKPWLKARNE